MKDTKFLKILKSKKWLTIVLIVAGSILLCAGITLFVLHLTDNDNTDTTNNNSDNTEMYLEGFADDSESALTTLAQAYDTENTEPTYDLYGEVGTLREDSTYHTVQTNSNFSSDSGDCSISGEGSCIDLGREKTVMPNHSTVNLIVWESYAEWDEELDMPEDGRIGLKAYAILPDESMAAISGDTKVQFNFYDKETRIVQMDGDVYYRVKPQEEGHVFTVQAGDRLIELDDTEAFVQIVHDTDAETARYEELGRIREELGLDEDYDDYEEYQRKSDEYDKEVEKREGDIYAVYVYIISGNTKITSRSDRSTVLSELNESNPFTILKYREPEDNTRIYFDADQEEINDKMTEFAANSELMADILFSMRNYAVGNFSTVAKEDLINMLMMNIDDIEPKAMRTSLWYKNDMEDFVQQWNTLMTKISSCKDGWYQAASNKCCPNGYAYNSEENLCTKTIYYCDEGYTLESDNMCHKPGESTSTGSTTQTPKQIIGPSSGGSSCVDSKSSKAISQLCRMGSSVGSSKISGSKCCFTVNVDPPKLGN